MDISAKINMDTITNAMVCEKLSLSSLGDQCLEIPPTTKVYSASTKAYKIQHAPGVFFYDVAKFMLEAACVHPKSYGMLWHKVGMIISTYEEAPID